MITENAIAAIRGLFEKSVRENIACISENNYEIRETMDGPVRFVAENRNLIALNISSYMFRIVVLLDCYIHAATVEHLAKILRIPDKKLEGEILSDAQGEFINLLCGAVNRNLCTEFRHVGMSTPFFLDIACSSYVSILNPTHAQSFEVAINDLSLFKLTLCTCVGNGATLNFHMHRSEQNEASTGELELF